MSTADDTLKKDLTIVGQIRTFSGKFVEPYNLNPDDVNVIDIAHSLARICRYQGHCNHFMSVAQHSVMVAARVPVHMRLTALLHDASEAYLGDMPRPLKRMPQMAFYREAEERAHEVIAKKFGCIWPWPPEIKLADANQLRWEFENLRDAETDNGHWDVDKSETQFLNAFCHYKLPLEWHGGGLEIT